MLSISHTRISHIIGVGTDIISIDRIGNILLSRQNNQFIERILTAQEKSRFTELPEARAVHYLAKRFAAKEAVSKALGTGIGTLAFTDIEVHNNEKGQPYIIFLAHLDQLQNIKISLSITDDSNIAAATAIAYLEDM